jgi:hypothetical protein
MNVVFRRLAYHGNLALYVIETIGVTGAPTRLATTCS